MDTIGVTSRRINVTPSFTECFTYPGKIYSYLQNIPIYLFKATFVEMTLIRGGGLEWQVARLAGQKSDQKYRRVNISDLSLGQEGPPAALGMFEPPISGPARLSGGAGR